MCTVLGGGRKEQEWWFQQVRLQMAMDTDDHVDDGSFVGLAPRLGSWMNTTEIFFLSGILMLIHGTQTMDSFSVRLVHLLAHLFLLP